MSKLFFLFGAVSLYGFLGKAQDLHTSQPQQAPLLISAGLCGSEQGAAAHIGFRQQWKQSLAPFESKLLSYEWKPQQTRPNEAYLALGAQVQLDQTGDVQLVNNGFALHAAYHLPLDRYTYLSGGMYVGYGQRSIEPTGQWGSQYNGLAYDQSIVPSVLPGPRYQVAYFDAGFGFGFNFNRGNIRENTLSRLQAGLGFYHVNRPPFDFISSAVRLPVRSVIFVQSEFCLGQTKTALVPIVLFQMQGASRAFLYGANFQYYLKGTAFSRLDNKKVLSFGLLNRFKDAVILQSAFQINQLKIALSADLTISSFSKVQRLQSAFEVQLAYLFK
jgi:type IX secretion system PorP/SprF family membrane protein